MKPRILLLIFSAAVIFTSCSTYKAGQTPDDVYYSPARFVAKEETKKEETRDKYEDYVSKEDDQYIRMKVRNRDRWSTIDDYDYWYDSRYDHCYCNCNNTYNWQSYKYNPWSYNPWRPTYYGYGNYYSPNYPIVYYKSPKVYTGTTGKANLTAFHNRVYNNQNNSSTPVKGVGAQNNSFGNLMKRVFSNTPPPGGSNSGSSESTSWDRPVRTNESGTAPSSSAGGKSGGYNSTGSSSGTARPPRQ